MAILFIMIPLITAFVTVIIAKADERAQDALAFMAGLSLVVLSFAMLNDLIPLTSGVIVYKVGNWKPPLGISLVIDGLSAFMLATVNLIALISAVYSSGYMKRYTDKWKFYALFLLMLTGINGVLVSGDIFNLYVFMEIAAISEIGRASCRERV